MCPRINKARSLEKTQSQLWFQLKISALEKKNVNPEASTGEPSRSRVYETRARLADAAFAKN
jgi:hypothetical protein